jgi:hypothetical protein
MSEPRSRAVDEVTQPHPTHSDLDDPLDCWHAHGYPLLFAWHLAWVFPNGDPDA